MKIYKNINSFKNNFKSSVLAIGNFDGVHMGHQQIFKKAKILSKRINSKFGIFTFNPLPKDFFSRKDNKILKNEDKINILKTYKPDFLIEQKFDKKFSKISYDFFVNEILIKKLKVSTIFVGKDFRFGFKRKGNVSLLKKYSNINNYNVVVVNFKKLKNHKISSSYIRYLISKGKIELANKIMGRSWVVSDKVILGRKIGRTIGAPTANIKIRGQIKPLFGVYAVKINIGKSSCKGVANYGVRPTFGKSSPILEVNLFKNNRNLYNKTLNVSFVKFIRNEKKFSSILELKKQIQKDIKIAKKI
jgi:riboflavin kinase / FMN adenylyltransferase